MVPAQYAMAPPQQPQTNQMMQMLYNPYGMYHQQQIPTVQMISPLTSPMPTPSKSTPAPALSSTVRPSTDMVTRIIQTPPVPQSISMAIQEKKGKGEGMSVSEKVLPEIDNPPSPEPNVPVETDEGNNSELQNAQQENLDICTRQTNEMDIQYHRYMLSYIVINFFIKI